MSALNNILAKEWTVFNRSRVVPFELNGLECMAVATPRLFHESLLVGKNAAIYEIFDVAVHVCVQDIDVDASEMETEEGTDLIFQMGIENLLRLEQFSKAGTIVLDDYMRITLPGELKRTAVEFYCNKMKSDA
jgi:hypothetical protein